MISMDSNSVEKFTKQNPIDFYVFERRQNAKSTSIKKLLLESLTMQITGNEGANYQVIAEAERESLYTFNSHS